MELPMSENAVEYLLPNYIISRNQESFSFTDIENRSIDESFTNIVNHNLIPMISVNQPISENRITDIGKCYQYINFFVDVGRSQITDIKYNLAISVNYRIFR